MNREIKINDRSFHQVYEENKTGYISNWATQVRII